MCISKYAGIIVTDKKIQGRRLIENHNAAQGSDTRCAEPVSGRASRQTHLCKKNQ